MKHSLLIAISLAALGVSGCNRSNTTADTPASGAAADNMGMASDNAGMAADNMGMASASPMASAGQTFADTAATSNTFEIESSKLAATKASSAKVKSFAEQMIKAHMDSSAQLKTASAAAAPAITPTVQMTPMQTQAMTDLLAKTGADFDTAYAKAQTDGHQMTLDALKAYSANGDVPSLKDFAAKMVPIVTAHLNMAKGL